MSKVIEGLLYSETHEWVKVEGDVAVIGVTDFAQSEMGDITYVDMPEADDEVSKDEEFGALESVNAPELINQDPYENWIIKVKISDPAELEGLMDAAAYQAMTAK